MPNERAASNASSFIWRLSLLVYHLSFAIPPHPRPLPPRTWGEGVRARSFGVPQDDMGRLTAQERSFPFRHSIIQYSSLIRHSDFVIRASSFIPHRIRLPHRRREL